MLFYQSLKRWGRNGKDLTDVKGEAKGLMVWGSNPGRARYFYLLQKISRPAVGPTSYSVGVRSKVTKA